MNVSSSGGFLVFSKLNEMFLSFDASSGSWGPFSSCSERVSRLTRSSAGAELFQSHARYWKHFIRLFAVENIFAQSGTTNRTYFHKNNILTACRRDVSSWRFSLAAGAQSVFNCRFSCASRRVFVEVKFQLWSVSRHKHCGKISGP